MKVDLEKAYDRVDWNFLKEVLRVKGFKSVLQQLIMECITTTKLAMNWNGEILETFFPSRGLCQGDPLSPYLFVLCMETLSHKIHQEVGDNKWRPIQLSKRGPKLSHLFFADDLLLFGEASFSQTRKIEFLLADFCGYSGQRVNRDNQRYGSLPTLRTISDVSYARSSLFQNQLILECI